MRIPKIFLSSKSDNFKSFKPYFESINWLVKVFYSSSFFGEFLFLILSHTEISTDFYPWVPAVHFAPSSPCNRHSPKIGPRWRTPKKNWLHFPLLMDCTHLDIHQIYWIFCAHHEEILFVGNVQIDWNKWFNKWSQVWFFYLHHLSQTIANASSTFLTFFSYFATWVHFDVSSVMNSFINTRNRPEYSFDA